jgi:hypothetical protein
VTFEQLGQAMRRPIPLLRLAGDEVLEKHCLETQRFVEMLDDVGVNLQPIDAARQ